MITGMDRLMAAVTGEKCDRIPVFLNLFDQGAKELGMSLEEYYSKGAHVAEGQLKLRDKYGYDNVWSIFFAGKEVEVLGCTDIRYVDDGPPNVGDYIIKNYDDIEKLVIPEDISSHPAFVEILECTRILNDEVGGKYPICAYVGASSTLPTMLMGMDKWFELLFMGPPDVRDLLLEKCSEFFRKSLAAYREAGANLFLYANSLGSTEIVSMKQFDELTVPWMKRDLDGVDVNGLIYYSGSAKINPVISRVIEETGIRVYSLSPFDDISEAKQMLDGPGIIGGVINDIMLFKWSEEEIRTEVQRIVNQGKQGGRFLLGTGLMPYGIPENKIRAFCEAAYEFGHYET